jgi:hypothetical protein
MATDAALPLSFGLPLESTISIRAWIGRERRDAAGGHRSYRLEVAGSGTADVRRACAPSCC